MFILNFQHNDWVESFNMGGLEAPIALGSKYDNIVKIGYTQIDYEYLLIKQTLSPFRYPYIIVDSGKLTHI